MNTMHSDAPFPGDSDFELVEFSGPSGEVYLMEEYNTPVLQLCNVFDISTLCIE